MIVRNKIDTDFHNSKECKKKEFREKYECMYCIDELVRETAGKVPMPNFIDKLIKLNDQVRLNNEIRLNHQPERSKREDTEK